MLHSRHEIEFYLVLCSFHRFLPNALPLLQILSAFTFPESPRWLIQQDRDSEAKRALATLRMKRNVQTEILMMRGGVRESSSFRESTTQTTERDAPLLDNAAIDAVLIENGAGSVQGDTKTGNPAVKWAVIIAVMLSLYIVRVFCTRYTVHNRRQCPLSK